MTRILGKQITPQQLRALQASSPSVSDILDNPEFAKELHEEIVGTYDQEVAAEYKANDSDVATAKPLAEVEESVAPLPSPRPAPKVRMRPTPQPKPAPVAKEEPVSDYDIDKELEEMRAKMREMQARKEAEAAQAAAEPEKEEDPAAKHRAEILKMLEKIPGAPSQKEIAALKQKYGDSIHVVALGDEDVYLFTHLRRGQLMKIQETVAIQAQQPGFNQSPEEAMKEKILLNCIVWPRPLTPEFWYNSRSGVIDTLYELISIHSYHLSLQQAMMLTEKL